MNKEWQIYSAYRHHYKDFMAAVYSQRAIHQAELLHMLFPKGCISHSSSVGVIS